jgi:hypothetical protein
MKVYDLDGCVIEKKAALIAVSLPKPENGNSYFIYEIHIIRKNEILIHLKDFFGPPLQDSANLQAFVIDLTKAAFQEFDFTNKIEAALIHYNFDNLPKTPEEIYDDAQNSSILKWQPPVRVGTGTIRP